MKLMKAALVVAMGLSISGCASMDVATRNAPFVGGKEQEILSQPVAVNDIKVNVSREQSFITLWQILSGAVTHAATAMSK